jgi:molecular chaperone DnaJ
MPSLRHRGRKGDLIAVLIVETPRHLTRRQEEVFRELAELEQKHVSQERKSFFDKLRDFFTKTAPIQEAEQTKGEKQSP